MVRQWLYDHGRHYEFLVDYETLDLSRIRWALKDVAVADLEGIPTGPSDQDFLDDVATEVISARSEQGVRLRPHFGGTEPGHVVPDPFEGLLVVSAGAGCVADDAWIETAVVGERYAEVHELATPVLRVPA